VKICSVAGWVVYGAHLQVYGGEGETLLTFRLDYITLRIRSFCLSTWYVIFFANFGGLYLLHSSAF
jgi:hypothetical protein